MRVSREQAEKNRARIIDVASREFREKGFDGIGVADVMKSAGLTHGGFYGHFASKDDLIAEACKASLGRSVEKWASLAEKKPYEEAFPAIIASYLRQIHRDNRADGCAMAGLAADVARQSGPVRQRFTEGTKALFNILVKALPGQSEAAKREKALATIAGMVGTIILSRAIDDPDFSDEILQAGRSTFGDSSLPPKK